jgi:hypothetical protein
LFLFVSAQKSKTEGHIIWDENYSLIWDDFQAKPKKSNQASAMSDITFSVSIKSEGNKLTVWIQPSFNPKGSWVKEDDKVPFLLHHEQVHFDIYEVNARKFRRELMTKKITNANAQDVINRLVEKYTQLNVKVQERYDEETDHSLKTEKQEKWNALIEAELLELEAFKEASFVVEIQ